MSYEAPVLLLNDQREGLHACFEEVGEIGTVARVLRYADGYEEFVIDLGNCCWLRARSTHFELAEART